jgi:eukaryotic-like serine/threonine-protein kinase
MSDRGAPADGWLADYELGERASAMAGIERYRAVRRRDERRVLIKLVRPGQRKAERALAALEAERELLGSMNHPSLPLLLDTLRDGPRGGLALVLADAAGAPLPDVLARARRVDALPAAAIGIHLAGALAAIHRLGHMHARLRLDAVELTAGGAVLLRETGMSTRMSSTGDPDLEAPDNMAPEQIVGHVPTAETDVFLLGKLLYELLTGKAPFARGTAGVTQQIRHGDPPAIDLSAPGTPRELGRIVARCLKKRPRDRYPDMTSVESELIRVLRAQTSLPLEVLVSRALAAAGLGDELPSPRERGLGAIAGAPPWLNKALAWSAGAAGAGLLALGGYYLFSPGAGDAQGGPQGIVRRPAQLRVLAQPWAEVHIDGELVDITPVGRPIEVKPGRHVVIFRHPHAPAVTREIDIVAGQTIVLDVEMDVEHAGVDAGTDAAAEDESP